MRSSRRTVEWLDRLAHPFAESASLTRAGVLHNNIHHGVVLKRLGGGAAPVGALRNNTQRLLVRGVPKNNPVDLVTAVPNRNEQLRHSCSINKVDQLGS